MILKTVVLSLCLLTLVSAPFKLKKNRKHTTTPRPDMRNIRQIVLIHNQKLSNASFVFLHRECDACVWLNLNNGIHTPTCSSCMKRIEEAVKLHCHGWRPHHGYTRIGCHFLDDLKKFLTQSNAAYHELAVSIYR